MVSAHVCTAQALFAYSVILTGNRLKLQQHRLLLFVRLSLPLDTVEKY